MVEVVAHDHLVNDAGARVVLAGQQPAHHRPRRHDVAEAGTWPQGLGKGTDVQHSIGVIQGSDGVFVFSFEYQVGVTFVFENRDAVFLAQIQHSAPA